MGHKSALDHFSVLMKFNVSAQTLAKNPICVGDVEGAQREDKHEIKLWWAK